LSLISHAPPTTKEGHTESYADTVKMAEEVRKGNVGLGVRVVLGPHPAAFAHQFAAWIEESGEQGAERAM
jgi:predicted urease superfamily metal-dependent hydrolase